jgi:hypothetical protein
LYDARVADPGRFAKEFMLSREMGWTWNDIAATPYPVIEEFYQRLLIERRIKAKRDEIDKQLNSVNSK